jgi:ribosomal protein L34
MATKLKQKRRSGFLARKRTKAGRKDFAKKTKKRKKEIDCLKMLKKIYRLSGEDLKKFFSQKHKKISNEVFLIFYQKNDLPLSKICSFAK